MLGLLSAPGLAAPSFDAMLKQADEVRTGDPTTFYRLLSQLEHQQESATKEQRDKLRLMRSHGFLMKGQSELAIKELQELQTGSEDVNLRFRAGAMLANTYAVTRRFEQGLSALNEALPLASKVTDRDSRHHGLMAAGILYNQVGEYSLGRDYAQQVLEDDPKGRSKCLAGNLVVESLLGLHLPVQEEAIFSAIQACEQQDEALLAGFSRTYLARKWVADGKLKNAIDVLERHLSDVEATKYPRLIGEYHSMLADYRMKLGQIGAAEKHANTAVAQGTAISGSLPLVVAHRVLYEIASRRGDPAMALEQYKKYANADKAYLNEIKTRELAYQLVRQQILQKNQQISALDQKNQVLQLQRKVDQTAAQNTRLIVILLILLIASIGYWAFKIKRVQLSLKKMAETDALTGICNRHHFTIRAERALAECARNGEQASLIMFDLDHFKNINDRFGHGVGDWALKEVAEASKGFCRRIDVLGRLGGEEFAILMYGCDLRAAARVAEDCRVRLAQIETRETGHVFAITGSFGVTSSQHSGYSLAKLLSHADKQLYRAKHAGRNRVCVYDTEQENARAASNVLEMPQRDRAEHLGA
ncbi:GGDEF domain-containing protein [Pseudoxanthomonas sp.]|uniref:tetratricopeptide repeat-containing diguanylate cyclase n=1 Tax=Pseudoxanthomonas sp. TaxID=1871049 RepID=UPI002E1278CD